METVLQRDGFRAILGEPELYVDNAARKRSGHMTHAMLEWTPGKLIDFNANSSSVRCGGHSTFGWVEYRTSADGGKTFSPVRELPYSKTEFEDGIYCISVEKAVRTPEGGIAALCLRNDALSVCCQPWATPVVVVSRDGGESWSEPHEFSPYPGRIYAACNYGGAAYAMEFCNDGTGDFCGEKPEHLYRLFVSRDNGGNFTERGVVPLPTAGRGYCAMLFDAAGVLHAYAYNKNDERHLDHVESRDGGETWSVSDTCYLAKGIRNPQTACVNGIYVLHGRAEKETGFVLYFSRDGVRWDEGEYIGNVKGSCYYSNNLLLRDAAGERLLIQYSETYRELCVNVMHRTLRIEKD